MQKETFIIRTEWYEAIAELDPQDQATILRNLFAYHIGDTTEVVLDTFGVRIVWKLIEPTLSRNIDTYDRKVQVNRENGKLGGRPSTKTQKETQINPNNPTVILPITQKEVITLSDSDSDSVSEYEYDSVSDSESVDFSHTPEKQKFPADMALPAPGISPTDQIFYEQEICMAYSIDFKSLANLHTAWVGDRTSHIYTKKEARLNFKGYVAKWKENTRNRSSNNNISKQSVTPITYEHSG